MKIILKETVDDLGRRGQVVDVRPGYARNFLIPRHLGLPATQENLRRVESERKAYLARETKRISEAEEIAEAIRKLQITIPMKAGPDGHLFGSVSNRVIAEALTEEKIVIEPKMVRLEDPIRELGVFNVKIKIHPEVDVDARVWVVEEKAAG